MTVTPQRPPEVLGVFEPFTLLSRLHVDRAMVEVFSEAATVAGWLRFEIALAQAQADEGMITAAEAAQIEAAAELSNLDLDALWVSSRVVGYPILPLVRQLSALLPGEARLHYGATTQDVMDTGLALQLRAAIGRLDDLAEALGDALALQVATHRATPMAARTHAQQAVPTTFGAMLSTYLVELERHRRRLAQCGERTGVVSLHGAGGTSAAYGPRAAAVRRRMAEALQLRAADVPWHVTRDGLAEFGFACAALASTCARLASEVIALSRTEIDELSEAIGHHRGASSTMPQKANPIASEAVLGFAATAQSLVAPLLRAMEAGHQRAAGEWQIEWSVLPRIATDAASALACAVEIAVGMLPKPENMARNLALDGGSILAEAYMMHLAPELGRERAHDVVYAAVRDARQRDVGLHAALVGELGDGAGAVPGPFEPVDHLGDAERACAFALALWAGAA